MQIEQPGVARRGWKARKLGLTGLATLAGLAASGLCLVTIAGVAAGIGAAVTGLWAAGRRLRRAGNAGETDA